jgi:hypothetical protein
MVEIKRRVEKGRPLTSSLGRNHSSTATKSEWVELASGQDWLRHQRHSLMFKRGVGVG